MPKRLHGYLLVVAFAALSCIGSAQDIHILLRAGNGKTWFHLGEPITLEAACINPATQLYLMPCSVALKAEAISVGTRLSADRIEQFTWADAQSGSLPPQPRAQCGNIDHQLPTKQSNTPTWQEVTLEEPFPVYPGRYKISASLAFDLEMADRLGEAGKHSSSDELEIGLDDNLKWKDRLIGFHNCDYDDRLTLIPDADAIAALVGHLDDCAVEDDQAFAQLLHRIVWLKMQVEQPDLYSRMVTLERGQEAAPGEAAHISQWFRGQYRRLLLQTARQLIAAYKSHPELHGDENLEEDLQDGFKNWHDAAAMLRGGADSYVSRGEVTNFLKQAGRSPTYIAKFLKEEKSILPGELPEYQSRPAPAE